MPLRGAAGVLHDTWWIRRIGGKVVGRVMLEATLEALAQRGVPQVVLWTAGNEAAQQLFAKIGFRHTMVEMTGTLGG